MPLRVVAIFLTLCALCASGAPFEQSSFSGETSITRTKQPAAQFLASLRDGKPSFPFAPQKPVGFTATPLERRQADAPVVARKLECIRLALSDARPRTTLVGVVVLLL
ncbi:MAG: hypothetical protein NVV63_17215 [Opitutus sp.]|nr:hypothetical protein [Opitutus sp.]